MSVACAWIFATVSLASAESFCTSAWAGGSADLQGQWINLLAQRNHLVLQLICGGLDWRRHFIQLLGGELRHGSEAQSCDDAPHAGEVGWWRMHGKSKLEPNCPNHNFNILWYDLICTWGIQGTTSQPCLSIHGLKALVTLRAGRTGCLMCCAISGGILQSQNSQNILQTHEKTNSQSIRNQPNP